MNITVDGENGTAALAARLAAAAEPGDVFFLRGALGAGKTSFARAFIRALTQDPATNVPSPTFTLVQTYDTPRGTVWHFDLYRLRGAEDVYELGWEEALHGGITLAEWPERLEGLAPPPRLEVTFGISGDAQERRIIELAPHGERWTERLEGLEL